MSRGKSKGAVVIDPAKAFQQACAFADWRKLAKQSN